MSDEINALITFNQWTEVVQKPITLTNIKLALDKLKFRSNSKATRFTLWVGNNEIGSEQTLKQIIERYVYSGSSKKTLTITAQREYKDDFVQVDFEGDGETIYYEDGIRDDDTVGKLDQEEIEGLSIFHTPEVRDFLENVSVHTRATTLPTLFSQPNKMNDANQTTKPSSNSSSLSNVDHQHLPNKNNMNHEFTQEENEYLVGDGQNKTKINFMDMLLSPTKSEIFATIIKSSLDDHPEMVNQFGNLIKQNVQFFVNIFVAFLKQLSDEEKNKIESEIISLLESFSSSSQKELLFKQQNSIEDLKTQLEQQRDQMMKMQEQHIINIEKEEKYTNMELLHEELLKSKLHIQQLQQEINFMQISKIDNNKKEENDKISLSQEKYKLSAEKLEENDVFAHSEEFDAEELCGREFDEIFYFANASYNALNANEMDLMAGEIVVCNQNQFQNENDAKHSMILSKSVHSSNNNSKKKTIGFVPRHLLQRLNSIHSNDSNNIYYPNLIVDEQLRNHSFPNDFMNKNDNSNNTDNTSAFLVADIVSFASSDFTINHIREKQNVVCFISSNNNNNNAGILTITIKNNGFHPFPNQSYLKHVSGYDFGIQQQRLPIDSPVNPKEIVHVSIGILINNNYDIDGNFRLCYDADNDDLDFNFAVNRNYNKEVEFGPEICIRIVVTDTLCTVYVPPPSSSFEQQIESELLCLEPDVDVDHEVHSNRDFDSLVQEIRDFLPYIEYDRIHLMLEAVGGDKNKAIQSLLEGD